MAKIGNKASKTDQFFCPCGGEIKMSLVAKSSKLSAVARCQKCGREERKPSFFFNK